MLLCSAPPNPVLNEVDYYIAAYFVIDYLEYMY